jgi:hypothetical protein
MSCSFHLASSTERSLQDNDDAFDFGYDAAIDLWDDEHYKCCLMDDFFVEVNNDVFDACKGEFEDEDDADDLIGSCEDGARKAIRDKKDACF